MKDNNSQHRKSRELDKESPFNVMKEVIFYLPRVYKSLLDAKVEAPAKLKRLAGVIQKLCEANSDAMLASIHLCRDCDYTVYHPLHQAILCEVISVSMGVPVDERVSILSAALTANIAVIDLQEILHSQKTPLSHEQQKQIKEHPENSHAILTSAGVKDEIWLQAVLQHHEANDGKGYPQGLSGEEISNAAAFLAVTDCYTAMVSSRSYREPMTPKQALQEFFMQKQNGRHEEVAIHCIKEMSIYPPGSFVNLENGEVAVVTKRGTKPIVSSFISPTGDPYSAPMLRDCAKKEAVIKEACIYEENFSFNLDTIWECGE